MQCTDVRSWGKSELGGKSEHGGKSELGGKSGRSPYNLTSSLIFFAVLRLFCTSVSQPNACYLKEGDLRVHS